MRPSGSKKSGFVDPKKLIVMGGSYGGYLSMMAVTKAPECGPRRYRSCPS